jgi:2-oxoisovalerate dehydrogenase E1 component
VIVNGAMLNREWMVNLLRTMYKIRYFEERVEDNFDLILGPIMGGVHLYIGQEAVAVGACAVLQKSDYIVSSHRGHGHCIAKGGDVRRMMAELMGKETGYSKGRGGSMHLFDVEIGLLGGNGIVGGGIPIALGAAFSAKYRESGQVVVSFFGDGAANQGTFHESLNMASLWKLPVVYICENNFYAASTPTSKALSVENVSDRACSYGIPGLTVDGMNVLKVYEATSEAVARARAGEGPTLIECKTYRYRDHCMISHWPRSPDEQEKWRKRDPILLFEGKLLKDGLITPSELEKMKLEVKRDIDEAEAFAKESPFPSIESMKEDTPLPQEHKKFESTAMEKRDTREATYAHALNEALQEEMERDETVLLIGEDLNGLLVTKGLLKKFGNRRVRETPVSESAIIGCALGAAITGLRPIAEIMYFDFITTAMDQVANQVAKMSLMSGGQVKPHMVIRTMGGAGTREAAHHSQNLEAWFVHTPGLKVVTPSTAYDAKGLLKSSIRGDSPVLFIEHRLLYSIKDRIPKGEFLVPLGRAAVRREGEDITIVATSLMVHKALKVAEELSPEISLEVIDPRTIVPLDIEKIIRSVKKTGRLLVVHEACTSGGVGAEIVRQVVEKAFDYLDCPPLVLGGANTPMPYSPPLEDACLPQQEDILQMVKDMI